MHNFADRETDAFMGVFDGHGNHGDKCAQYVTKNLPRLMADAIAEARAGLGPISSSSSSEKGGRGGGGGELTKESTHEAICKAHVICNSEMHSASFDDSLSGTTSISAYLQGDRNRITINNVGDSRAVIGRAAVGSSEGGGNKGSSGDSSVRSTPGGSSSSSKLKSYALSRDQTPYRLDERVRIRKTGARILSLDQVEGLEPIDLRAAEIDEINHSEGKSNSGDLVLGDEIDEGGDPPRVWHPNGDYPGTAFTRSFGDAIAEKLGVIAVPEMLTHDLTPEDKIIVLASDGVFEFLTNQSVIDICAKFTDPLEACRAVVAESYELWLQYELRTDDITMICIFVDGVAQPKESDVIDQSEKIAGEIKPCVDDLIENADRPVRNKMTLEKSRALVKKKMSFITDVTDVSEDDFDIESLYSEKTVEENARIAAAISTVVIFQNITDEQRELICKVMEPMEVKKGQCIVKQGTVGDRFYIVDYGSFEVRILAENQADDDGKGGDCVHVYEGSRENNFHPTFGELALKYSAPRAASIIAQNDGKLWALHRYAYSKIREG
jgi:serine/threonine protein phosphatase PrpC